MYYQTAYNALYKISHRQLNDINNIPDFIRAFGKNWTPLEYADFISENYFKCLSPLENNEIAYDFTDIYKYQTAYFAAM